MFRRRHHVWPSGWKPQCKKWDVCLFFYKSREHRQSGRKQNRSILRRPVSNGRGLSILRSMTAACLSVSLRIRPYYSPRQRSLRRFICRRRRSAVKFISLFHLNPWDNPTIGNILLNVLLNRAEADRPVGQFTFRPKVFSLFSSLYRR
jgi:hypothetical protein